MFLLAFPWGGLWVSSFLARKMRSWMLSLPTVQSITVRYTNMYKGVNTHKVDNTLSTGKGAS